MLSARYWKLAALATGLALGSWALLERGGASRPIAVADGAGADRPPAGRATTSSGADGSAMLFRIDATAAAGATGDGIPVTISRQAALRAGQAGRMAVALPDGTRYSVRYERSESAPDGNWTFIGRVDTTLGALASVITFGTEGVFGTLPTPDGDMMKFTTRGGQVFLQPAGFSVPPGVDPSRYPDYTWPEVKVAKPATASADLQSASAAVQSRTTIGQGASVADGEVTITILAVYTKNLSQLRGSSTAAETEYRNLVAVMNQAHIDSGTLARFEIAGFVQTDYPADASIAAARNDIEGILPDGTDLAALRGQHAADLVAMIRPYVPQDLYCGISQFPGQPLQPGYFDRSTGYSVTAVEACAPIVFAHEIGHNLGLMHDRETVAGPHGSTLRYGTYPFSFGHRQLGPPGFTTIMAYESESRPRLDYFSHPGTTLCGGAACGDAARADNVRAINLSAESISRFRNPPGALWIPDMTVQEHGMDQDDWSMRIDLSSPAPAGGVTFDIAVLEGSAERGVDVDVVDGGALTGMSIPEGRQSVSFRLRVHADDVAESPEAIHFQVRNVQGNVAVLDDEATLTIVDHDSPLRLEGNVRMPVGIAERPEFARVVIASFNEGIAGERSIWAPAPHYRYQAEVEKGSLVQITAYASTDSAQFRMQDVIIEGLDEHMLDFNLRLEARVPFAGRLLSESGKPVTGVPVILWNPNGDGSGPHVNWSSGSYSAPYEHYVLPGTAMQLEVRDPPPPNVRQVVEVPPMWAGGSRDIQLRRVPSLTIPHVTVPEGTAADGDRTMLLTASLSVPGSQTGVSFDVVPVGSAGADDFHLPQTHFKIPKGRSRVEVPVVIRGDDRREGAEVVELRITNVQGAAWNPGPGSLRIATDDGRPGDGSCTGSTADGGVIMCQ